MKYGYTIIYVSSVEGADVGLYSISENSKYDLMNFYTNCTSVVNGTKIRIESLGTGHLRGVYQNDNI